MGRRKGETVMTDYGALSDFIHAAGGAAVLVLFAITLYIVICYAVLPVKRWQKILSCLMILVLTGMLQGMGDIGKWQLIRQVYYGTDEQPSFIGRFVADLPWFIVAGMLAVIIIGDIVLCRAYFRHRKRGLSPWAVKESLDYLPDGVCFADDRGNPLLVNEQMNRISSRLYGTGVLNADEFWKCLRQEDKKDIYSFHKKMDSILIEKDKKEIWEIRRQYHMVGRQKIQELTACNVTEPYQLKQKLEERNKRLDEINHRLHDFSRQVEQMTREEEILHAKVQVHDEVGRSLLAVRTYLAQPLSDRNREELLAHWKYVIAVMRQEAVDTGWEDDWQTFVRMAEAIQVQINFEGEFPSVGRCHDIFLAACRECLANTVKHAKGHTLFIRAEESGDEWKLFITNDGKQPEQEIVETGGLGNLRNMIENADGDLVIRSLPQFEIRIRLPKGEK